MLLSSPAVRAADDEADEPDESPEAAFATDAAPAPAGPALSREALVARLKELVADPRAAEATVGVAIIDTADGRELFTSKADVPLIPASNMKLITTASALVRLGSSWRFQTRVGLLGDDLVVLGGGDPNLSGRFYNGDVTAPFRAWAEVLKQRGIRQIRGNLVIDDSLFEAVRHHPHWLREDLGTEWAAPVGALLFNDSCLDVYLRGAAEAGKPAIVRLDPPTAFVAVANGVRTQSGKTDAFTVALRGNPRKLTLSGAIRPNVASKVHCEPVDDPGLYAGTVIKETLLAAGLPIQGDVVRRRIWTDDWQLPEALQVHLIHTSSLVQSIAVANTRSQNLYAETILKTLASFAASPAAGDPQRPTAQGSWTAGSAVAAEVMAELGLSTKGCVFDDGSGLSPGNRLTAGLLANLLAKMAARPEATQWMASLAKYREAGGSLRSWPAAPALEGRLRGKSGKLTAPSSRCLSGYLRTRSGKTLAFSFLANNIRGTHYPVMQWMAQTLTELTRY